MSSEDPIQALGRNIQEKASVIWNVANSLYGAYKFKAFFDETVQEDYTESMERYTRKLEESAKYQAIMNVLAGAIYRKYRNGN